MKVQHSCDVCGTPFMSDSRNIARGWGRCCSKTCAAVKREDAKRNGWGGFKSEIMNPSPELIADLTGGKMVEPAPTMTKEKNWKTLLETLDSIEASKDCSLIYEHPRIVVSDGSKEQCITWHDIEMQPVPSSYETPTIQPIEPARENAQYKLLKEHYELLEHLRPVINEILEAILDSIEWEVKDGKLIISSKINYAKNIETHDSKKDNKL